MVYEDNIKVIKGIGEKTEKMLNKLGIFCVGDLLEYYPRSYDIYKKAIPISLAKEGEVVTIEGFITDSVRVKKVRNLVILTTRLKDDTDSIKLTWFNMPYYANTLKVGSRIIVRGKVDIRNGFRVIEQGKLLSKEEYYKKLNSMTPIYKVTTGLSNTVIYKAIENVLASLTLDKDYLPSRIRKDKDLMDYKLAIKQIHFPKDVNTVIAARKRLVFDEFFLFTLALNRLKNNQEKEGTNNYIDGMIKLDKAIKKEEDLVDKFANFKKKYLDETSETKVMQNTENKSGNSANDNEEKVCICDEIIRQLPFELTNAQLKTLEDIKKDMKSGYVMNRLIQGDVGSGKTIVAALALAMAAVNGYQGVIMVPTEVLAKQHYESFIELFDKWNIKVELLVGSMKAKEKRIAYEKIAEHKVDIIVGTHALIQDKVEYSNLGLVITDEQHRFGVKQRQILSDKGYKPHVIVMSATPIPRTLAIILYGDLDISVINELPSNRLPIKNCVVGTEYRQTACNFIAKEVSKGHQAYVICPMVEESETIEAENVVSYVEKMKELLPPYIEVEYLHGKMRADEKNYVMQRFVENKIHVLVSTTVIEVGVNVPNATVMMVENAERFGLAQLHQLRGRVGRGAHQSYCIFVAGHEGKDTKKRLEILNKSNDGFYIASEDLKLRGPGDMFGIRQSGDISFKIADVFNDATILQSANEVAKNISIDDVKEMLNENSWVYKKIVEYAGEITL